MAQHIDDTCEYTDDVSYPALSFAVQASPSAPQPVCWLCKKGRKPRLKRIKLTSSMARGAISRSPVQKPTTNHKATGAQQITQTEKLCDSSVVGVAKTHMAHSKACT